ncbi:MAG TPA: hypothetical protein VJC10_02135 [Patescibacteria group bacterium]|nr:hypothetical protein [Patescibacteria group bacterium]
MLLERFRLRGLMEDPLKEFLGITNETFVGFLELGIGLAALLSAYLHFVVGRRMKSDFLEHPIVQILKSPRFHTVMGIIMTLAGIWIFGHGISLLF